MKIKFDTSVFYQIIKDFKINVIKHAFTENYKILFDYLNKFSDFCLFFIFSSNFDLYCKKMIYVKCYVINNEIS